LPGQLDIGGKAQLPGQVETGVRLVK